MGFKTVVLSRDGDPDRVLAAPEELIDIIENAMIDFGPDRHCDGADQIAALAWDWCILRLEA